MVGQTPMEDRLTDEERKILLRLARQSLEAAVHRLPLPALELSSLPERLRQAGASFVTLTRMGELRGCIGALESTLPLAEDVSEHAAAAALHDYRFPPVQPAELESIEIEISRLTTPAPIEYQNATDFIKVDIKSVQQYQHKATSIWAGHKAALEELSL